MKYIFKKYSQQKRYNQVTVLTNKITELERALSIKNAAETDKHNNDFCCDICTGTGRIPMLNSRCGHTYCDICWVRFPYNECPSCKRPIQDLIINWALLGNTIALTPDASETLADILENRDVTHNVKSIWTYIWESCCKVDVRNVLDH
jgi:hypothetical protein